MGKIYLLIIFILSATHFTLTAGTTDSALHTKVTQWMSNTGGIHFLENKGQMMDMQHKPVPNVLYEASSGGMDVYVTTSGLSYVFEKIEKHKKTTNLRALPKQHDDSIIETWCRADMQLVGADIRKENIVKEGESTGRSDYYYGDICPNGILGVHSYEKVIVKNIYPGIDWVLHGGKNGLKYDFIVHPGANPSQIKLKYRWTDAPQLQEDGSIKISTPMGNITEGAPASFAGIEPVRMPARKIHSGGVQPGGQSRNMDTSATLSIHDKQVQTTYSIQDNEIHFNVSHYNAADMLIIDPVLKWATYYANGSTKEDDEISSMNEDGKNVWITGTSTSTNFPTYNPGNGTYFQGTYASTGGLVIILQFNINGVLQWATYYGGTAANYGNSIYSDGNNVWVAGYTNSSNFPTLNPGGGAYYQATVGGENVFILKFSTTGVRKWATYYGGSNADQGYSIQSDGKNVWVTGEASSTDFPTFNPGGRAYFQGAIAGSVNAFILQFDTAGIRKWATYYGGDLRDLGFAICSDNTHVWVTGYTNSSSFPTLNPGGGAYFQNALVGNQNVFILKFDTARSLKWATYYGSTGSCYSYCINSDGTNVYVGGTTTSTSFPTLNPGGGAYFQGTGSIHGDGFILQFDTAGVCKWATYYGGSGNGSGGGDAIFSIQSLGGNIYAGGETSSTDFPTYKPGCGFYQDTLGHNPTKFPSQDMFILQFTSAGAQQWATYYGTDIEDDGSYVWTDGTNLFIAGDVQYAGYRTLNPGGGAYYWDSTITLGYENVYIGKFIINSHGASGNVAICKGSSTTLSASGGISYCWSPPAGLSDTTISNPVANPTVTTTYTVTIVDTGACGGTFEDSIKVTVDTLNFKNIRISRDTTVCHGSSVTLHASGGPTYKWSTGSTGSSTTINSDTATTTYTVAVSNGACIKDTGVTVTVAPKINGAINGNLSICNGHSTTLTATGGTSYRWSNGSTASSITVSPISNTTYSVLITQAGCSDSVSASVAVNAVPSITACCNTSVLPGQAVQLNVTGIGTGYSYSWGPPDGLNCTACPDPIATPQQTTTYTVIAINDSNGCVSLGYVTIDVSCGNVFVPDAFTPNAAYNNILYVRGNCIASILFEVFDRWGNQVFESISTDDGWDGKFKNKPMNMDTYIWFLKATLKDGTTLNKSGNVTLIR